MAGFETRIIAGRDIDTLHPATPYVHDGHILTEVTSMPQVTAVDTWSVVLYADETPNENAKTITVPAGQLWQILWIWIEYSSDATVGTRQLSVQLRDSLPDIIGSIRPNATQAASLTRNYMIGPSLANLTAFYDTSYLTTPLPPTIILGPGDSIYISDRNLISAGDDMVVQMRIATRPV